MVTSASSPSTALKSGDRGTWCGREATKKQREGSGGDPSLTEGLTVCLRFKLEAPSPDFVSLPLETKSAIHPLPQLTPAPTLH